MPAVCPCLSDEECDMVYCGEQMGGGEKEDSPAVLSDCLERQLLDEEWFLRAELYLGEIIDVDDHGVATRERSYSRGGAAALINPPDVLLCPSPLPVVTMSLLHALSAVTVTGEGKKHSRWFGAAI